MEKIKRELRELYSPYLIIIKYASWEFMLFFLLLNIFLDNTLLYLWNFLLIKNLVNLNEQNLKPVIIIFLITLIFSLLAYLYYWAIKKNNKKTKIVIIICILIIQFLILAARINIRFQGSGTEIYPHDGITQTEVAIDFLLQGKNPYQENYYGTALDNERDHFLKMTAGKKRWTMINPALESYAYMPLHFILPLPFKCVFTKMFDFYDGRILNFIFYLLSCLLIYRLTDTNKKKNCLLVFFTLNPLMHEDLIFGYSDIMPIYFLLLSYYFLKKERYSISIIALTLAGLIKQNILFFWPFFLTFILFKKYLPITKQSLLKFIKYPLIMLLPICVVLLPFILWNPVAFYHDTVYYLGHLYPARGIALAGLLVRSDIIKHPLDSYNFEIWQIIFITISLPLLLYRQYKNNTPKNAYLHGTLLMGGVWFFSRNFTEGHLDVVITNLLITLFLK